MVPVIFEEMHEYVGFNIVYNGIVAFVPIVLFWKIPCELLVPIAKVSECCFPVYVIVLFPEVPFTGCVIAKHVLPEN